jgi:hypothetical protein
VGYGATPHVSQRAFFRSLNYAPTKWSASQRLAFAVGKSAFFSKGGGVVGQRPTVF